VQKPADRPRLKVLLEHRAVVAAAEAIGSGSRISEFPDVRTTLVRALQAEVAASQKPLRIHVERFNPALRLYERLGFRQIEARAIRNSELGMRERIPNSKF
jgi:hypothetical protein